MCVTIVWHVACKSIWVKCPCQGIDIARVLMIHNCGCNRRDLAGGHYYIMCFTLWVLPCPGVYENSEKSLCCRQFRSQTAAFNVL